MTIILCSMLEVSRKTNWEIHKCFKKLKKNISIHLRKCESICVEYKTTKTKHILMAAQKRPVRQAVTMTGTQVTDRQGGPLQHRQKWKKAASRPNTQAIRWRDWQTGWPDWQAARCECKWTARKSEQHSDILTTEQSGGLTGRDIDGQTDRWRIIWLCLPPSQVVHKGLEQVAWGLSLKPQMTSREEVMESFKRWQLKKFF